MDILICVPVHARRLLAYIRISFKSYHKTCINAICDAFIQILFQIPVLIQIPVQIPDPDRLQILTPRTLYRSL